MTVENFEIFSNDLVISKAIFITGPKPVLKMTLPFSNIISDFSWSETKERVIFYWSCQTNGPEAGDELRRLISKKEQKLDYAINEKLLLKEDAVWLVIKSDEKWFDIMTYRYLFNQLLNDGINPTKYFKKIFIIIEERKGECVYELDICEKNEKLAANMSGIVVRPAESIF